MVKFHNKYSLGVGVIICQILQRIYLLIKSSYFEVSKDLHI